MQKIFLITGLKLNVQSLLPFKSEVNHANKIPCRITLEYQSFPQIQFFDVQGVLFHYAVENSFSKRKWSQYNSHEIFYFRLRNVSTLDLFISNVY